MTSTFGVANFAPSLPIKTDTHADDDGEGGDDDEPYEPNVSFTPVVNLAEVEVKTGEEDENVLFCERAKLYRFDSAVQQMKERGIGEMKILQHKTSNACRILMRREQVLKICANHRITNQMDLKPHQTSDVAFVWSAMDFADGEAKHESLCVKFKSSDLAKNFSKMFNEAKAINENLNGAPSAVAKNSSNDASKSKPTTNDIQKPKVNANDDGRTRCGMLFLFSRGALFTCICRCHLDW